MKYSKKHPLRPVYDFQKQILRLRGKIDEGSDLLAYFEGRSIYPERNPVDFLVKLAYDNLRNDKIEKLIKLNYIVYRNDSGKNPLITHSLPLIKSRKWNEPCPFGYSDVILSNEFGFEEIKKRYPVNFRTDLISWRENVNTRSESITLGSKYIDIVKLIINGYSPVKEENKQCKNLLPVIIITAGLIISAFIYAFAHRYEIRNNYWRIDKWTGTMQRIEVKK